MTGPSHCLVSFRGLEAPAWVLEAIRDGRVPGVCLFAFNFRDLGQFQALTASLHEAAREGGQPPPLVAIDQEGGQLMAVGGGATELPGNMALGATRSPALARTAGRILGAELAALGVNVNLAPVLDLATRPANPVVGLRSFGDDPDLVAALGAAMVEGMQGAGVLACAKHFPGHGDTDVDSHHAAPTVDRTLAELMGLEVRPFRSAFDAGLAAVMTAHVRYPALEDAPATFSAAVNRGLLRERLGFDGLILTDALDMHALNGVPGPRRARLALQAGADLAVLGHLPGQERIVAGLAGLASPGSRRRVAAARARLAGSGPQPVDPARDWAEHALRAKEIARAAVTVVSGAGELPLALRPDDRLCVVTVAAGNLTPAETAAGGGVTLADQVARRHPHLAAIGFAHGERREEAIGHVLGACEGAHTVVLATVDAVSDPAQRRLFDALREHGHRPVVVALRSPLDALALEGARAALCCYGRRADQTEAAVAVLFGEAEAKGTLPVGRRAQPPAVGVRP